MIQLQKKIIWKYKGDPPKSFYSFSRGACQKLPNGNVLITESDKGHVFEITRDGKIVWEFFNPDIDEKKKKRAAIYRMMRLDEDFIENLSLNTSTHRLMNKVK